MLTSTVSLNLASLKNRKRYLPILKKIIMNHSCIESLKARGWCLLPEKLAKEYVRVLGARGVILYLWLAAHADIDFSVAFHAIEAGLALGYSETTIQRKTQLLKNSGLLKQIGDVPKPMYQLLWIPCGLQGEN